MIIILFLLITIIGLLIELKIFVFRDRKFFDLIAEWKDKQQLQSTYKPANNRDSWDEVKPATQRPIIVIPASHAISHPTTSLINNPIYRAKNIQASNV